MNFGQRMHKMAWDMIELIVQHGLIHTVANQFEKLSEGLLIGSTREVGG